MLGNQQYMLNKVSLNRNVQKTGYVLTDWQVWWQSLTGTKPCISPRSHGSVFTKSVFIATLQNIATLNSVNWLGAFFSISDFAFFCAGLIVWQAFLIQQGVALQP